MTHQYDKAVNNPFVNLMSMRETRASESPDATAYIWLATGEQETERVCYADLRRSARSIAVLLANHRNPPIAALLYPPGLEFISAFFGCMYAGLTAVPLRLPRHGRDMT